MTLVPSLLQAIVQVDGEALVMHAGDKPYVVTPGGQVDLASRGLTLDAVNGIVDQLLPPEVLRAFEEFGAAQHQLASRPDFPQEEFTVVAARGGDDVWVEIRRRRIPEEDRIPDDIFGPAATVAATHRASTDDVVEIGDAVDIEDAGRDEVIESPAVIRMEALASDDDLGLPDAELLWGVGAAEPSISLIEDDPEAEMVEPYTLLDETAEVEEPELLEIQPVLELPAPPRESAREMERAPAGPQVVPPAAMVAPLRAQPASEAIVTPAVAQAPIAVQAIAPPPIVADSPEAVAAPMPVAVEPAPLASLEPPAPVSPPAVQAVAPQPVVADPPAAVAAPRPVAVAPAPLASLEPPAPVSTQAWQPVAPPPVVADPPAAVAAPRPVAVAPAPPVSPEPPAPVSKQAAQPIAPPPIVADPPEAVAAPRPVAAAPAPPVSPEPPAPVSPHAVQPVAPQPGVVLSMARSPIRADAPSALVAQMGSGLDRLLRLAWARGAATLYLSSDARPSVRVDGENQTLEGEPTLTSKDVESLLLTLMPERSHEALRSGAATEWICDIEDVGRVRCMTFRDQHGPGGVFRMMPGRAVSMDELALSREIQALAVEPEGLVLVAGPRSSGKRTLLSAFIDVINRTRRDHVISIESEINIVHDRGTSFISQREVRGSNDDVLTAARAALREDPDVLVVEDLCTGALMNVALEAAASGHLVIGGFSAHSTTGAIDRIIDLYAPEYRRQIQMALAKQVRGVVVQVLLRKNGGGRVAARELLLNTPAIASVIAEGKTSQLLMAIEGGRRHGMMPLNDALVGFVQSGAVDAREAYRRAADRAGFLSLLKRQGVDISTIERLA